MKVIVFAGGSGKRFWPLSRKHYPKQFQPIVNDKSTIQLMVERVADLHGWDSVYIPTTKHLVSLIKNTLPSLPEENIIVEPTRRDLGAAVGYALTRLAHDGFADEPVTILWSDSFPQDRESFEASLKTGKELIEQDKNRIIFLGETPTFANDNVGWIESGEKVGEANGIEIYEKKSFKYRPNIEVAKEWFQKPEYLWNTGYFITSPSFVLGEYEKNDPKMYEQLNQIGDAIGTEKAEEVLNEVYPQMEATHFDNIVLEHLDNKNAIVLKTNIKWSDPGTLYALKEFLQQNEDDNVKKGLVYDYNSRDCLVYNLVKNQIVTTVNLDGFVIVNTPDAVIVLHKNDIGDIKKMLKEWEGTELERYL